MICFLDYRISDEELNNIYKLQLNPIIVPKTDLVYPAINGHVDIQLSVLDKTNKKIIVHKDIDTLFIEQLTKNNINYIKSRNSLGYDYPNNIMLNSLILDTFFIHNTKYSDPNLLDSIKGKKIINVKQGYTKCSILPLNEKAIITNDSGIAKKMFHEGVDVLHLPYGDIELPSFDYGFIGGVGGMINDTTLALFGELAYYSYGKEIYEFTKKHKIEVISLKKKKLIDRGSLLTI